MLHSCTTEGIERVMYNGSTLKPNKFGMRSFEFDLIKYKLMKLVKIHNKPQIGNSITTKHAVITRSNSQDTTDLKKYYPLV